MPTAADLTLAEVTDLIHGWYPPDSAEDWDAVGLVLGDPDAGVRRVMLAVDPTLSVAEEAAAWDADLLICHHPLLLRPVHSVARTTPKGRVLGVLSDAGCALLAAHTNADRAISGVSEAMALTLGMRDLAPLVPGAADPQTGIGRIGTVDPTTLGEFAEIVAARLPSTPAGIRFAGDRDRLIATVALCGGAGDSLLDTARAAGADVYVTSDLRHHLAGEFLEHGTTALIDVPHWAAEWTWLPVLQARLGEALGATVEIRVSTTCTDPWTQHLPTPTTPTTPASPVAQPGSTADQEI